MTDQELTFDQLQTIAGGKWQLSCGQTIKPIKKPLQIGVPDDFHNYSAVEKITFPWPIDGSLQTLMT